MRRASHVHGVIDARGRGEVVLVGRYRNATRGCDRQQDRACLHLHFLRYSTIVLMMQLVAREKYSKRRKRCWLYVSKSSRTSTSCGLFRVTISNSLTVSEALHTS
jgi:hypothetical protein